MARPFQRLEATMADLSALTTFLSDDGGFTTPLLPSTAHPEGKTYRVPSPDAKTGLRLAALQDIALKQHMGNAVVEADVRRLKVSDDEERDFIAQVLSAPVVEQMVADGCRWEHVKRIGLFGYILFTAGEKAAMDAVEGGLLEGKAPAPATANRAARRQGGATRTGSASRGSRKPRQAPGA